MLNSPRLAGRAEYKRSTNLRRSPGLVLLRKPCLNVSPSPLGKQSFSDRARRKLLAFPCLLEGLRAGRLAREQLGSPGSCIMTLAKFDPSRLKFGTANQRHPFSLAAILLSTIQEQEKEIGISHGRTRNSKVVQRRKRLWLHQPSNWRGCFRAFLRHSSRRLQEPARRASSAVRCNQRPEGLAS